MTPPWPSASSLRLLRALLGRQFGDVAYGIDSEGHSTGTGNAYAIAPRRERLGALIGHEAIRRYAVNETIHIRGSMLRPYDPHCASARGRIRTAVDSDYADSNAANNAAALTDLQHKVIRR